MERVPEFVCEGLVPVASIFMPEERIEGEIVGRWSDEGLRLDSKEGE